MPPGPESARHWAVLLGLIAGVGLAHAAVWALAARCARGVEGRAGALLDASCALIFALVYAFLALSLVKFVVTHSHLVTADLRFLGPSLRQVLGEGTAAERKALAAAALLPLALTALFAWLLRTARTAASRPAVGGWGRAVALFVSSITLLGLLSTVDPAARWAATTLLPEAALVRALGSVAAHQPAAPVAGAVRVPIAPYRPKPPATRPNVVVVLLESVPWERLFGSAARPQSTPRLLELARESVAFEFAYAVSSHSDYAQTAILSSLHPRKFERHDFFARLDYPRALPWDVLGAVGYRSGLFSTQNERWGNMLAFVVTPSLSRLRHAPDFPDEPRRGAGAETKLFEATALSAFEAWLDEGGGAPFFAALNFQATHFPYVWPPTFEPPYGAAPIDFDATFLSYPRERIPLFLDRFHNALAYVDLSLGRLVDTLRARGLWQNTVLAVVADHGEAFYEHGVPTHGTTLHDEQVRVPMLLRLPGVAPRAVAAPVSTLDLMPTLYRALGLPRHGALQGRDDLLEPGYTARGRALLLAIQGMTSEDALVLDGWKWLLNRERQQAALYRLDADGERADRRQAEPEVAAVLAARLDELVALQLGYYARRDWERGLYPPRLP